MIILVTGAAGFIGFHLCQTLLANGHQVVGVDNLNDYYDVRIKQGRLQELAGFNAFRFAHVDIAQEGELARAVNPDDVDVIVNLAAQAGVRYSIENPLAYVRSNLDGYVNVLEFARAAKNLKHLVYASSSSVYGDRGDGPFCEDDIVRSPASLYAATKISGEVLTDSYVHLYGIPATGLRFFTVYGAWGRPDMAYWIFTEKILSGEPITLFAAGEMSRDFTYIDDIVSALDTIVKTPPQGDHPHEIYNLGNSTPTPLMELVASVEAACGKQAQKIHLPKQPGDVNATFADISKAQKAFGYNPKTKIKDGIPVFVDWYRSFYNL
ncbi:MAG TPA: NAD-dependent epimerase/dehydratase family protein [Hellea balneolensis]|uniref:NAD-dependent epimerase/dehydratase family protein n=1 Tax=Hellea balneolensis TaxID=287478 RepID=A0A7C5R1T1_9PROT|nr:NAD-dependent epimerase/dehydratase family protein [Hellea balneolensis]